MIVFREFCSPAIFDPSVGGIAVNGRLFLTDFCYDPPIDCELDPAAIAIDCAVASLRAYMPCSVAFLKFEWLIELFFRPNGSFELLKFSVFPG